MSPVPSESTEFTEFTDHGRTEHLAWSRTGQSVDVVFLHGFTDSATCWSPLVPSLRDRWGLLAVNARGHGGSGLPEEPFGRTGHAADAALVLESADGVRPEGAVVVGHSMGAVTAAALAASRPDLVRAVVLEDPPPGERPTAPVGDGARRRPVPDWLTAAQALDRSDRIARCRADNPDWPDDELEPWAVSKEQLDMRLFERPTEGLPFLPDVLAHVRCPVLLVHGDTEAGSLVSRQTAQDCAKSAAGAFEAVQIEGAGHSVRRDRRAPYLAAVTAFLEPHA